MSTVRRTPGEPCPVCGYDVAARAPYPCLCGNAAHGYDDEVGRSLRAKVCSDCPATPPAQRWNCPFEGCGC